MDFQKKLFWFFGIVLVLSTLVDLLSAVGTPIFKLVESNPLWLLTNSKWPLYVGNVLVLWYLFKMYRRALNVYSIYIVLLAGSFLSVGHLVGAYTNIEAYDGFVEQYGYIEEIPVNSGAETVAFIEQQNELALDAYEEEQERVTPIQKLKSYLSVLGVFMLLPLFISYFVFIATMRVYNERQPEREKIINQILIETEKLKR